MVRVAATLLLLLALGAAVAQQPADSPPEDPREVGLVERSTSRLAQLDITVIAEPEVLRELTAADFTLKLNRVNILDFRLDRLCGSGGAPENVGGTVEGLGPALELPPATYMLYFDQPHLTMGGRLGAIEIAREFVRRVLPGNNRITILSNAARLEVVHPLSADRQSLLDALDALENDREQWDLFAHGEPQRIADVVRALNDRQDVIYAIGKARTYQKEETWHAVKSMRRLKSALGQLVDLEAPRVALYFADTLRSNPGEHYLTFFGQALLQSDAGLAMMDLDSLSGGSTFDRVVNEASAQGIRIYTVQAEGLVANFEPSIPSTDVMVQTGAMPASSRERHADAQKTLRDLAAETGGYAFLNGIRASKIAERMMADSSCLFVASFDPSGFPQDAPLPVVVNIKRSDARVRVRGRMVLQSERTRLRACLVRAFDVPGTIPDAVSIRAGLVPTGFADGNYSALLQISVPGTSIQDATWDLGASLVREHKVRGEGSGRLSIGRPLVPVIFEAEMRFKPGDYEIVAVGHESSSGLVTSVEFEVAWPDPNQKRATIGPIAILQPFAGAFLRDGESRTFGSLVRSAPDPVLGGRPAALVGLVCRGRRQRGRFDVERSLVGESVVEFPALSFDLEEDRCAQVRDVVPANTLGPGYYRYEVRVLRDGETLDERRHEFLAVESDL